MNKLFIFFGMTMAIISAVTSGALAVSLSTTCPAGYVAVVESAITITSGACPAGTSSLYTFTIESCLVATPSGTCFLYAPANTDFSDPSGTFQFSEICPLTL